MKFFVDARFTPGADPAPRMEEEKRRVAELREEGLIEQVLRRLDDTGAYLVMNASGEAEIHAALQTLPFKQDGTMSMAVEAIEAL